MKLPFDLTAGERTPATNSCLPKAKDCENLSLETVNAIVKQLRNLQNEPAEGITVRLLDLCCHGLCQAGKVLSRASTTGQQVTDQVLLSQSLTPRAATLGVYERGKHCGRARRGRWTWCASERPCFMCHPAYTAVKSGVSRRNRN
jgi:hypothetical protein